MYFHVYWRSPIDFRDDEARRCHKEFRTRSYVSEYRTVRARSKYPRRSILPTFYDLFQLDSSFDAARVLPRLTRRILGERGRRDAHTALAHVSDIKRISLVRSAKKKKGIIRKIAKLPSNRNGRSSPARRSTSLEKIFLEIDRVSLFRFRTESLTNY